jgi:Rieske Fe-S protein
VTVPRIDRRAVLIAGTALGGGVALAACGASSSADPPASPDAGTPQSATTPAQTPSETSTSTGQADTTAPEATRPPADALATLADIPVGGAVAASGPGGSPLLVARPAESKATVFSAICTHQGCTVAAGERELVCPCHGSVYDASTGQVVSGPAPSALHVIPSKVVAGAVVLT